MNLTVDDIDRRLIDLLQENARLPVAELARQLDMSNSTVKDRIARLEKRGIIKGYRIDLDLDVINDSLVAHVMIDVKSPEPIGVVRQLQNLSAVKSLSTISGDYDYIAVIRARNSQSLDKIIDQIRQIEGILGTTSFILLSKKFER